MRRKKANPHPVVQVGAQGEEDNSRSRSYTPTQQRRASNPPAGGKLLWVIDDRADELTCTEIVSRYQVPHEYVLLTKMVNALHPELRRQVVAVICDSKQTHSYGVRLNKWNQKSAERIALMIESVAIHHCGGTNGIIVNCRGNQFYLEAIWDDERLRELRGRQ